ncbi:HNH endonuclease [Vibrio vulnificus]|uniref:HNH endonuclease n=1 Tax=Vibrio vulnificus TaxID=672 RepID=UPI001022C14A|nr:HNH endonuclease [Vibrio vulnificus]RZP54578.1 HNH endonuclease [Vibrio vulnificus]RZR07988.1 HNH endonuclease [Vibrio vulnificus]
MGCFICDVEITDENDSKEHIFLNCIGGRKKVSGFLCAECNNRTGSEWDSEVDKHLSSLALQFKIKRDRGSVPSKKITCNDGKTIYYHANKISSDAIEHEVTDGKLIVKGPSKKRVEQYVKMLEKRNDISLDHTTSEFRKEYNYEHFHFTENFHIPPLESSFSKSIAKSAVSFFAKNKLDVNLCNVAKEYLVNNGPCCVNYAYDRDLDCTRPFATPFHYIKVLNEKNKVYAYIELYGFIRYLVLLSDSYQGCRLNFEYALDPTTGNELNLNSTTLLKVAEQHPATYHQRVLEEFRFAVEYEQEFLSKLSSVQDQRCLESYEEFQRIFLHPTISFLSERLLKIERKMLAHEFIVKKQSELTEVVINFIKYNKLLKSDS